MSEPVRLIGVVEDIDGVQVRVGVDYSAVTVVPGGRFTDEQFTELMTLLQQAYEDPQRNMYYETEDDIGRAIHEENLEERIKAETKALDDGMPEWGN